MTYPLEEYIGNIDQLCNFISQRYYKLIDGRTENSLSTGSQFFSLVMEEKLFMGFEHTFIILLITTIK